MFLKQIKIMRHKDSTGDFIRKANKIHGSIYDYSIVDYTGAGNKIKIICKIHGIFTQVAKIHLRGSGCPICADIKKGVHSLNLTGFKKCNKCENQYPSNKDYFYKNSRSSDGLVNICKKCSNTKTRQYELLNIELVRKRQRCSEEKYRKENRVLYNENARKLYALDPNVKKSKEKWKQNNREKDKESRRNSVNKRLSTDMGFKLLIVLRARMRSALKNKGHKKSLKTINLIGCSIEFLKNYIENQFTEGMSWDNYGKGGWEVDHIKPCAAFDLSKEEEQRKCFHYTNLQPLWYYDNRAKGATLI